MFLAISLCMGGDWLGELMGVLVGHLCAPLFNSLLHYMSMAVRHQRTAPCGCLHMPLPPRLHAMMPSMPEIAAPKRPNKACAVKCVLSSVPSIWYLCRALHSPPHLQRAGMVPLHNDELGD